MLFNNVAVWDLGTTATLALGLLATENSEILYEVCTSWHLPEDFLFADQSIELSIFLFASQSIELSINIYILLPLKLTRHAASQ